MSDFKKNITKVTTQDREKYFQMPQKFQKYVDKKDKQKNKSHNFSSHAGYLWSY